MNYYSSDKQEVMNTLQSGAEGLTSTEAEKRAEKYGKNKLAEGKKDGIIKRFFKQLCDPMILILIGVKILIEHLGVINF